MISRNLKFKIGKVEPRSDLGPSSQTLREGHSKLLFLFTLTDHVSLATIELTGADPMRWTLASLVWTVLIRFVTSHVLAASGGGPLIRARGGCIQSQQDAAAAVCDAAAVCQSPASEGTALQDLDPPQELEQSPMLQPPPRSPTASGYVADPKLVTWAPFRYAAPSVRREAARDFVSNNLSLLPPLPPLRVVLMGGVAVGKGTIAPMISQAFRVRCIGVGALLRGETRAGRPRGLAASKAMAAGELLPDEFVLDLLKERLGGQTDAARTGCDHIGARARSCRPRSRSPLLAPQSPPLAVYDARSHVPATRAASVRRAARRLPAHTRPGARPRRRRRLGRPTP